MFDRLVKKFDWILVAAVIPILAVGLITMYSFSGQEGVFDRQLIWVVLSLIVFFSFSFFDFRFLKNTKLLLILFGIGNGLLLLLFVLGSTVKGATSWLDFGAFSLQPADFMKLVLILMLAKYFSRRHIEIKHLKHIFVSSVYMFIPFVLVFFQPDFGSAIVLFMIWFGMILVSGISKKHLFGLIALGIVAFLGLWLFVFAPYQRARIVSFLHPLEDIQGTGYNAYQSTIAVGSGQLLGKGIGYGTQSRLNFLPEYETDFIFAAFSEEWGFVGSVFLIALYGVVMWRLLRISLYSSSNFESLFGIGVVIYLMTHITVNMGMNIGLMPVTGIPLPFMSQGGSHLLVEMMSIGIVMSFKRHARSVHKDELGNEFLGVS
jgi:rod shape determining protein RodA